MYVFVYTASQLIELFPLHLALVHWHNRSSHPQVAALPFAHEVVTVTPTQLQVIPIARVCLRVMFGQTILQIAGSGEDQHQEFCPVVPLPFSFYE